jgi:CubicO group peptidase (beta-lactamase class C family)
MKSLLVLSLLALLPAANAQTVPTPTLARIQFASEWLNQYAAGAIQKTGVPGVAVAIVYRDQVIDLKSFGVRKVDDERRINPDTIFQIGGISEALSATGIAAIVQSGYLHWDDRVATLDPDFRLADTYATSEVTLRDFLGHRSGLPLGGGNLLRDLGFHQSDILARLRLLALGKFRYDFADTDFGFTEAAMASARHYGDSFEGLMQTQLFTPLGMGSTTTEYADHFDADNRAVLHVIDNNRMTAKYLFDTDAAAPAIGINSNARDLAKWMAIILNRGVLRGKPFLSPADLRETYLPQTFAGVDPQTGRPRFFGMGWNVDYADGGRLRISQSGNLARGAGSIVTLYPDDQVGILVLTNAAPAGLAEAISGAFFDVLYSSSPTGELSRDWLSLEAQQARSDLATDAAKITDYNKLNPPAVQTPPSLPLGSYTGTYRSAYYGDLEIRASNAGSGLVLLLGAQGRSYPLRPWDGNTFTYEFDSASQPAGRRGVVFAVTPNAVQYVRIDNFSAVEGMDVFARVPTTASRRSRSATDRR